MLLCYTMWMSGIFLYDLIGQKVSFLPGYGLLRRQSFGSSCDLPSPMNIIWGGKIGWQAKGKDCQLLRKLSWTKRRKNFLVALSNSASSETCPVLKNPHCKWPPTGFVCNSVVTTELKDFPIHLTCPFSDIHYNRNHHKCKICTGMAVEEAQGCKSSCVLFTC